MRGAAIEARLNHLIMAHELIEQDHAKEMLPVLRQALMMAGRLLAYVMSSSNAGDSFH